MASGELGDQVGEPAGGDERNFKMVGVSDLVYSYDEEQEQIGSLLSYFGVWSTMNDISARGER
jgi:hypothetical protein